MKVFSTLIMLILSFLLTCSLAAQTRSVNLDGGKIVYHQTGHGHRILFLLHGFMANGAQWQRFTTALEANPFFAANYTVIAPDLPGYGASINYPFSAYRPLAQQGLSETKLLYQFLVKLHLQHRPIDIAGNSLGGLIATMLTTHYAFTSSHLLNIQSLSFIGSPVGVKPLSRTLFNAFQSGFNPFIPINKSQFTQEIKWLIYDSSPILKHVTAKEIAAITVNNKQHYEQYAAISSFLGMEPYLSYLKRNPRVKQLRQPVAIFWGKNDDIFTETKGFPILLKSFDHVAMARAIPHAGHVIMLESGKVVSQVATLYAHFLASVIQQDHG